jgi:hypothetical protein
MNPTVPPPHELMPKPIATDTTKAIVSRPILLNVMRFLNPRERPACATPFAASNSVGITILTQL